MLNAIVVAGTVIGLPITAWFTWDSFKTKSYLKGAAGALTFFALAAYTMNYFGSSTDAVRVFGASGTSSGGGTKHKFMNKRKVEKLLKANAGRIFGVTFVKKDGSTRNMTCRGGVRKYVKGVGMSYNPKAYDLRVVFDLDKMQYRMVPINRVLALRIQGKTYKGA